jgi:hypothetical protein
VSPLCDTVCPQYSAATALCDPYVKPTTLALTNNNHNIPQYSSATASLNVNCSAAIVLEHFARWARLEEAPRLGYKFVTHACPPSCVPHSGFGIPQMRTLDAPRAAGEGDASDGSDAAFDPAEVLEQGF